MKLTLFFILSLFSISCSTSETKSTKNNSNDIIIELSDKGLFINSKEITSITNLEDIKSLLGPPSKENLPTPADVKETKEKFGGQATNSFVYDEYGILIQQYVGHKEICSINIFFKENNRSLSPSSKFKGSLKINGKSIDGTSSLGYLKLIPSLNIDETVVAVHKAKYTGHNIIFEFINYQDKNGLVEMSIENNNIPETTNEKGWTSQEIESFRAGTAYVDKLKQLSKERKFNLDKCVDCYVKKITSTYTFKEIGNPTTELQKKCLRVLEECMTESSERN